MNRISHKQLFRADSIYRCSSLLDTSSLSMFNKVIMVIIEDRIYN